MKPRPGVEMIQLSVGSGQHDLENPHRVLRKHGTATWILEYTVSGRAFIRGIDGGMFFTEPGEVTLFRPEIEQDYGMDPQTGAWMHYWICFYPRPTWVDLLAWPEALQGINRLQLESMELQERVREKLHALCALMNRPLARRDEFILNGLEEILLWCDTVNPRSASSQLDARIRRVLEWLHAHSAERTGLPQLARQCHLSESRLSHLFREQMDMTPMQYRERHRIQRAREKLLMSAAPISQIAYEVGFRDPLYFSRVFRRYTKKSPREFRRQGR